jgi:hypothetical protein
MKFRSLVTLWILLITTGCVSPYARQATSLTEAYNRGDISTEAYRARHQQLMGLDLQWRQNLARSIQQAGQSVQQQQSYNPTYQPPVRSGNRYDPNSLANPYGAGSPYKADGLMNPYSQYGSEYSNKSWKNPYATDAPKLYDSQGRYRGKLGGNKYDPDSTSNPYGQYGSKHSPDSINNPYGAGSPYSTETIYVVPSK